MKLFIPHDVKERDLMGVVTLKFFLWDLEIYLNFWHKDLLDLSLWCSCMDAIVMLHSKRLNDEI